MAFSGFDLSGKVALITGGNGGLGLGMAQGLAEAGAEICIWGRNADKNNAALEQLSSIGPKITALQCDVGDEANVESCFAQTLAAHGRVDGCFANAGVPSRGTPFDQISTEEWNDIIRINQSGVFYVFRAATRHMKERAKQGDAFGRLIGISSLAAISGAAGAEHYAATKGGLISVIKSLAIEYARYGVTANTILPGWCTTDMTTDFLANDVLAGALMPRIPVRRWGKPEDFAAIAIYLMSNASSYHTADSFLIDGGYFTF